MLQRQKNNMPFKRKKPRAESEGTLLSVAALGEEEEKEKGRRQPGRAEYIHHACKL